MKLSSKKRAESPERHACRQAGSRRSMTLIELLISLAIIGIMTGIAFPYFAYYQKRSNLDSDISNFVSLFNYARALQNNPDNISRVDTSGNYNYVIEFTNDGSTRKAELYSKNTDPKIIIDKVDFAEDIIINNNPKINVNGLVLEFSGFPPKETLTCSIDCSTSIKIGLKTTGTSSITKTATISNSSSDKVLSITTN